MSTGLDPGSRGSSRNYKNFGPLRKLPMKEVWNKCQIKNILYYLIKWVTWLLKYNFYKLTSHLISASKAIANFKHMFKHKQKEIRTAGQIEDPTNNDETAPRKHSRI